MRSPLQVLALELVGSLESRLALELVHWELILHLAPAVVLLWKCCEVKVGFQGSVAYLEAPILQAVVAFLMVQLEE